MRHNMPPPPLGQIGLTRKNQIRTHNANEQMGQAGAMSEGRFQRRLNFADESREVRFSLNILIHFDIERYVKTACITVYHRWI